MEETINLVKWLGINCFSEFKSKDGIWQNYWAFKESSGYNGYRNIDDDSKEVGMWIYDEEYTKRIYCQKCYYKDYELPHKFRLECLPFGEYPDYVIQDFLNKKYFKD